MGSFGKEMIGSCNVCGSKNPAFLFRATDYISGRNFDVIRCRDCGLGWTYPQPSQEGIKEFYPAVYHDDEKVRFKFLARQYTNLHRWLRLSKIQPYLLNGAGRMLDIGCGRGWLLKYFKEKGWEVCGTEFSEINSSFACKQLGLDVRIGEIKDHHFNKDTFDVVSLWHTLEHLPRPKETLEEISRITKKEGIIFISVPNFASWQARIFKKFWFLLDVPRHLYHFTPESLGKLLKLTNFRIIHLSFSSVDYGFLGIVQSLFNLLGGEFNFLWDFVTQKAGKVKCLGTVRVVINLLLLVGLGPFCLILGIIAESLSIFSSSGSVITVVAKKVL